MLEKLLYPSHSVSCIKTGPSKCGKSLFPTNLFLSIIKEFVKLYIYPPSLHQSLFEKLIKCFINYIPIHIIANVLNAEEIDIVIEKIVNDEVFQKSDCEIETYEAIEQVKFPQKYNDGGIIILDDLNEKQMNDSRVQALFKRSRHKNYLLS